MNAPETCRCGSNLSPYPLYDGYGIFLQSACPKCERAVMAKYRPDIRSRYDCDEPIDPE